MSRSMFFVFFPLLAIDVPLYQPRLCAAPPRMRREEFLINFSPLSHSWLSEFFIGGGPGT